MVLRSLFGTVVLGLSYGNQDGHKPQGGGWPACSAEALQQYSAYPLI
jgi:hypothetical protein